MTTPTHAMQSERAPTSSLYTLELTHTCEHSFHKRPMRYSDTRMGCNGMIAPSEARTHSNLDAWIAMYRIQIWL